MMSTAIIIHTQSTNDDYNNSHTHRAQMMITTTTIYTKSTNVDYNLSRMVKKMSFQSTFDSGQ